MTYYREFERTHKELIDELIKVKKLEREEHKEAAIDQCYKKIKSLYEAEQKQRPFKPPPPPSPVPPEQKQPESNSESTILGTIFSLFKK